MKRSPLDVVVRLLAVMASVIISAEPARGESTTGLVASVGKFDVTDDGAATYTIPIKVPPGAGGMQPTLTLNYSSRGGNGPFGVGWSVGGLSAITRCTATIEQDGFHGPPAYGTLDRFCLDGQRLMLKTGTYGVSGSEYRTERDSFTKVVAYGQQGSGPQYFVAKTKAGLTMEFGATTDSRIEAKDKADVRVWAVNKITDSVSASNTITFIYEETLGQYFPKEILYSNNKVVFVPEPRTDYAKAYYFGSEVTLTSRIKSIDTSTGTTSALRYAISYEDATATKRSRIKTIQECAGAGSPCLEPIQLDWTDIATNTWPTQGNPAGKDGSYAGYGMVGGDFNGDGFGDFVWMKRQADGTTIGGTALYGWFGGLSGSFTVVTLPMPNVYTTYAPHVGDFNGDGRSDILWDPKLSDGRSWDNNPRIIWWGAETSSFTVQTLPSTNQEFHQYKVQVGDFNGDGRSDLIWLRCLGREGAFLVEDASWVNHKIRLSNGDGTFTAVDNIVPAGLRGRYQGTLAYLADFNGDGLTDIFWDDKKVADGRTDDKTDNSNTRDLWINRGVTTQNAAFDRHTGFAPTNGLLYDYQAQIGDLNGDGNADFFWYYGTKDGREEARLPRGRRVWLMKGDHTFHEVTWINENDNFTDFRPYIADFNGDGIGDILWSAEDDKGRTNGMRHLWRGNGRGEFELIQNLGGWGSIAGWTLIPMDLNGDGLLDIFWDRYDSDGRSTGTQRSMWFNNVKSGIVVPDLVKKITDGLGAAVDIYATPMTNPWAYQKTMDAAYPFMDFRAPMYVTWATESSNGVGGKNTTTYWYKGAKLHHHGRGFVGFQKLVASEGGGTNLWTVNQYLQLPRFTYGLVEKTEAREASAAPASWETGGKVIKRVTNTWDTVKTVANQIEYPYASLSVEEAFDLTSGAAVKSVAIAQTMDTYGNPTAISTWTAVGSTADGYAKGTVNEYYPADETKWHLGRLKRTTVTASAPNQASQVRTSFFMYDASTGLLRSETVEPDNSSFILTTLYSHGAFGNRSTAIVSGAGIQNRMTATSYGPDGKFPLVTTNALGHQEVREYDHRFGTVTKLTGPNGLVTRWEYDSLGRKTKEIRADGSETAWQYLLCGTCAPENLGKYWLMTQPTDAPPVTTVHDNLGREVSSATYGFNGQLLSKDTRYDAFGNVLKGSRKYFSGGTILWTSFLYDKLGRVTRETGPDGGRVDTSYDKLCTTATAYKDAVAPGQVTKRCRSTQDQIISVLDATQQTTTYQYDGFANLVKTIDAHGNQTVMAYDVRGRKIEMIDPDLGRWTYVYDSLGQLLEQVSPKERDAGQKTTMTYDKLGRMLTRTDADGSSTWIYDSSPVRGIGKLWKVARAGGDFEREHLYDDKGRPSEVRTTIDGETFSIATEYEPNNSRVKKVIYPGGAFAVAHSYTTWGYLKDVKDAASGALYWKGDTADADGNFTLETLGNGVQTARGYNAQSGMLSSISTAKAGAPPLQELRYDFDWLGNLRWREDQRAAGSFLRETFAYDTLNRLTGSELKQGTTVVDTQSFTYDAIGNLATKSDVGTYTYAGPRPHAVTNISGSLAGDYYGAYEYDSNGNMTSGAGRSITWTAFNNVQTITKGGIQTTFTYDSDRARIKAATLDGSSGETVLYVSSLFESVRKGANRTDRYYVSAGGAPIAVYAERNFAASDVSYLHRDHLGSLDLISTADGSLLERFSYDAWGKRRPTNWIPDGSGLPILPLIDVTGQGFTGHQQFDLVGVIHMNGRVYDPTLGRFLSPDPFIQDPYGTQNLNRYSYVLNNPLSYTDPSGYFFKKIGKWFKNNWRQIVAVAVAAVVTAATWGAASWAAGAIYTAVTGIAATSASAVGAALITGTAMLTSATAAGAVAGGVVSGSWNGVAQGALSGLSVGLGGAIGAGVYAELRGGSFLGAAFSSAFSSFAGAQIGAVGGDTVGAAVARVGAAAVIGGTAAEIGGGKFANGAVTASFLQTTVESGRYYSRSVGQPADIRPGENPPGQSTYSYDAEGRQFPEHSRRNVIGLNADEGICIQGSICSRLLNTIPGINATARLHDRWFNDPVSPSFNLINNLGTMWPAATIAYFATIGNVANGWQVNPQIWHLATQRRGAYD